jgi:molybdenum cofactor synthesis domain-containing protein
LPGVALKANVTVHSEGILGVIGTPREDVDKLISEAERLETNLRAYTAKRVAVVSTGTELLDGRVKDTNLEAAREILGAAGYEVESGGVVGDDRESIAGRVARLISEGYGIVITTGGVGAEDKDCTVEALELLDPQLATAVLARYKAGHGRHVKDCVRIAFAQFDWGVVIALPGPTHEVKLALGVLVDGLQKQTSPAELIEAMAVPLRASLPHRHDHH